MLHFNITLTNPWVKDYRNDESFVKTWSISKNKAFEIQLNKFDPKMIFEIDFWVRDSNMDHKGVSFDFGLFGFWIHFDFYDKRHTERY
jgi:hypothetical protein